MTMRRYSVTCLIALAAIFVMTSGVESHPFSSLQDSSQNYYKDYNRKETFEDFLAKENDRQRRLKEKCMKNGQDTSYDEFLGATDNAAVCINDLVNKTELKEDIDDAKLTNAFNNVTRKYCKKIPILKDCFHNFTTALKPCLEESERSMLKNGDNVWEAVTELICSQEGAKIASFIAEGGLNCTKEKDKALESCINTTIGKYLSVNMDEGLMIPSLYKFGEPECQSILKFQECAVKELKTCKEPRSVDIIDSLFDSIYKVTPCNNV